MFKYQICGRIHFGNLNLNIICYLGFEICDLSFASLRFCVNRRKTIYYLYAGSEILKIIHFLQVLRIRGCAGSKRLCEKVSCQDLINFGEFVLCQSVKKAR